MYQWQSSHRSCSTGMLNKRQQPSCETAACCMFTYESSFNMHCILETPWCLPSSLASPTAFVLSRSCSLCICISPHKNATRLLIYSPSNSSLKLTFFFSVLAGKYLTIAQQLVCCYTYSAEDDKYAATPTPLFPSSLHPPVVFNSCKKVEIFKGETVGIFFLIVTRHLIGHDSLSRVSPY